MEPNSFKESYGRKSRLAAGVCRWVARMVGVSLVLMVVCLAFGEGVPNLFRQSEKIQVGFFALLLIIIGILAGWRWELAGGTTSLFGWGLFVMAVILPKSPNWFVVSLCLPGVFYLASALLREHEKSRGIGT
jgi:hypothetical protein